MKKIIFTLLSSFILPFCFADSVESAVAVVNTNSKAISPTAYWQNPYATITTAGGTQTINESQIAQQNFTERLFNDGTWDLMLGASAQYTGAGAGFPNYAYGTNIFGQTGQVAGFSVGGLFTAMNPFFNSQLNGYNQNMSPFLPSDTQVAVSEAYLEYQHSNILQADVGYIAINNSPWLSTNYYGNIMAPGATYQGASINAYPGGGWLLTALAFNGVQAVSETGFTSETFYNKGYDFSGGLIATTNTNTTSAGTAALGANYMGWDNQYNLRLWAYQFDNYGTLLYADNSIKFQPTKALSFNIAAQGGTNNANGSNAILNSGYGQIGSNFVGMQTGFSYDWFSLNLGYNNVWGSGSYGNGGLVSPYTYGLASDPLYTTPYMAGLVELGTSGSAYKISPSFNFLDGNLSIAPALTQFITPSSQQWNGTIEYDLVTSYSLPQIKGLNIFATYAYQQVPLTNSNGSSYVTQLYLSYVY